MALLQTDFAKGTKPMIQPSGPETVRVRMEYILLAALANGDVIEFGPLPADCVITDWTLENDDLDTATALVGDLGILNAAKTAVDTAAANGGAWLSNSTALQAAAFTRLSAQSVAIQTAIARMTSLTTNRPIGFVAEAAGTGGVGNKIALDLAYRSANWKS